MVVLVALSQVQDVLVRATDSGVHIASSFGLLLASLFGEFFVAAHRVHRGNALPREVSARGSAGLAATLGVDDREDSRRGPLHRELAWADPHSRADGSSRLLIDPVEEAELPRI